MVVVGGGASGMMAAIAAADAGSRVCLLEKNEKLGKKLFITGKGRCNVTNAGDGDAFFANVVRNPKFLYSAFYGFDNRCVMDLLERAGCRLKVERGDRVFPVSDHSSDVIGALERELRKRNVSVRLMTEVKEIVSHPYGTGDGRRVSGVLLQSGEMVRADAVIVATGGLSYPSTGSTGDGYCFAAAAGHRLVDMDPSLVPLVAAEGWCKDLMGLSLKNVSVRLMKGKHEVYGGFGEMLFTHFGVSGPLILSASSYYVQERDRQRRKRGKDAQDVEEPFRLLIDLKPALDEEQLDRRLMRDFEENHGKQFKNALNALFPARLIPVMVGLSQISPERKVQEVTKKERKAFGSVIKNLPLTIVGTRDYNEAIITKGGVDIKEINPSTMESRKLEGLYFAGEVLDLDALTGGFNLQVAWSTGHLAGESAGAERSGHEL